METKSFFGEIGLTSTSANHYANLAKEASRRLHNFLENVKFYSTSIAIIGDSNSGTISKGFPEEKIGQIDVSLSLLSKLNALIAFFREAIKEKDRLEEEAKKWNNIEEWEDFNRRYEELQAQKPIREKYITEEDVMKTWSIGEQEKYLTLEAQASVYGKFIHEDGYLSKARIALMNVVENPMSTKESGRDTIIYTYTPTIEQDTVDEMFFDLQSCYRSVQAGLNGMKKRIQDTIKDQKIKVDEEYRMAYEHWSNKMNALNSERTLITEDESARRMELLKEVEALKIVIPDRLRSVYESLKKAEENN